MKKIIILCIVLLMPHIALSVIVSNTVYPVGYYCGHQEERGLLKKNLSTFKKVSIVGISGIGKTQLARQYAYTNQDKYNLIWSFDGDVDLDYQFVQLARAINQDNRYGAVTTLPEGIREAQKAVLDFLKSHNDFLIIVDNLKENDKQQAKLFLNWDNNGYLIFCSQDAFLLPHVIYLRHLLPQDSEGIIRAIYPDVNNKFLPQLIKKLDGYPIAIANTAIFLKSNTYISMQEYNIYSKQNKDNMTIYLNLLNSKLDNSTKELLYKIVFLNNQSISKSFLEKLSSKKTFVNDLLSLNRYQILSTKKEFNNTLFELHDHLKNTVIRGMGKAVSQYVEHTVDAVNTLIPKGKNEKQELILSDESVISSFEKLLHYAEEYNIDKVKVLELKKNLMSFYLGMGVQRCHDLKKWFLDNKEYFIHSSVHHAKALSAEFMALIGIYDYFVGARHVAAINHLLQAEQLIQDLKGYEDIKYLCYSQLAQAYVYNADIDKTKYYLNKAEDVDFSKSNISIDNTLLKYIESKYFAFKGNYSKSLDAIEELIWLIKDHPIDYYYAPVYIHKAALLNYLGRYQQAYDLVRPIYEKEIGYISSGNAGGVRLKVIVELSRSEYGLGKLNTALQYASQSVNIYLKDKARENVNLSTSTDIELAYALITKADILSKLSREKEAMESYNLADSIYYNKYKDFIKNVDEVSYLYFMGAQAAHIIKDEYSFNKFRKKHLDKFQKEHYRSQQLLSLSDL